MENNVTRLCIVRHGETNWNIERRIQGQTDIPLNDKGFSQASALGAYLSKTGFSALYSSDLKRAQSTANAIAETTGLTTILAPELRERCYGIFEGLTYTEAARKNPNMFAALESRDPNCSLVNGESLNALYVRVTQKLKQIVALHLGQSIAVVTHGGVLDIVNRFVRKNPLNTSRDFNIPNAGINMLSISQDIWTIESWAETRHLEAIAQEELPS